METAPGYHHSEVPNKPTDVLNQQEQIQYTFWDSNDKPWSYKA